MKNTSIGLLIIAIGLILFNLVFTSRTIVAFNYFYKEFKTMKVTITAYSASEDETDSTPRITASNQEVRDGIVANNCLEFGTKVIIDGKIYEVQDRKNKRYSCEWIDVFIDNKQKALEFGIKKDVIIKLI